MVRREKNSASIESKFIKEFIISLLRAKSLRVQFESKKKKIIIPTNLPPTAQEVTNIIIQSDETTKTPGLFKSMITDESIAEKQSLAPRILLTHPKIQMSKMPVANYINPINLHSLSMTQVPPRNQPAEPIGQLFSSNKIKAILSTPGVQMIECTGPGNQILVTRAGLVSTLNQSFSEEEINEIMKEISQKTRIPLIPGLFKALIGNFLVIAVISEFVGTRFVIRRR